MQYEFEKLRVTLVSKDERMRTLFLFLFLFFFFSFFFFFLVRFTFTSRNAKCGIFSGMAETILHGR